MSQDTASSSATLERLRTVRLQTLKLVQAVDSNQASFTPNSKDWSIVEVLDHLAQTDATFREQLRRLFDSFDNEGSRELYLGFDDLDSAPAMVPEAALPFLEQPLRLMNRLVPASIREALIERPLIAFRAPSATRPDADLSIDELRIRLAVSVEETVSLVQSRDDIGDLIVDHPMFGRNTPFELLSLQWRHEVRHQQQIGDLLAHGLFPGGGSAPESSREASLSFADLERDVNEVLDPCRQMIDWWHLKTAEDSLELFDLQDAFPPYYQVQGFFDTIHLLGEQESTTIMGCLQRHRFQRRGPTDSTTTQHLETFIGEQFFDRCSWVHEDGEQGGFRYRGLCSRERDGELVSAPTRLHLSELRERFEWTALRVDILDFVRSHEQLGRFNDALSSLLGESAYIVLHDDLARAASKKPKNVIGEAVFGYAFLPRSVEPSVFGFGPGRFGAAFKQWRFLLFKNGDVEVRVAFVVTPRSEKVMNLGGIDPIYHSVDLAHAMTLGRLDLRSSVRDRMDAHFLGHHGNVHADVVLGMREIWEGQRWNPRFDSW